MRSLYPPIEPYRKSTLAVDSEHALYIEESGNPAGLPVVFLHGGPGAGCEASHRCFFNPQLYRIVLFDQRGCGLSTPHAELRHNTTQHLIDDIERIRINLGIDQWVVFGGSWGSTLALAYAQTHPKRCLGLILRGIFLCRERDISWFYQDGASYIFPDLWQDYQAVIPPNERADMVGAYYRRLTDANSEVRLQAARAWARWEGCTSNLHPNTKVVDFFTQDKVALSLARIECHYFVNQIFLKDQPLLQHTDKLSKIPGVIVHGRYDIVCPLEQAWLLHQSWQQAELHIIAQAGHSAFEHDITSCLVQSSDTMATRISGQHP
ncbi:MAG: prolyl aminopeptidase [Chromatiales bacterium]|nr:prolyl aminopeptidase [Chromatiales bacterium]